MKKNTYFKTIREHPEKEGIYIPFHGKFLCVWLLIHSIDHYEYSY